MTAPRSKKSVSDPAPLTPDEGLIQKWGRFWFTPAHPLSLHILRVAAGLLFIAWLLPFSGNLDSLFGIHGWFDKAGYAEFAKLTRDMAVRQQMPPESATMINWSVLYLARDAQELQALYWLSLAVLALFTLGVATRITAVLTWVVVVSFTANPAISYDADSLLLVLAFYLMIAYVLLDQRTIDLSWLKRLVGSKDTLLLGRLSGDEVRPSLAANLAVRLLQVHMAIIIVTSGLHKLQFGDWWAGVAFWYPMNRPFETTVEMARTLRVDAVAYVYGGLAFLVVLASEWAVDLPRRLGEHVQRTTALFASLLVSIVTSGLVIILAHLWSESEPAKLMFLLSMAAYATLAWQIGFPLYAWRPRWLPVLLGGAAAGWIGLAFIYKLPVLGPALFAGCLAFVPAETWLRLFSWLGLRRELRQETPAEPEPAPEQSEPAAVEAGEPETCITVGHR